MPDARRNDNDCAEDPCTEQNAMRREHSSNHEACSRRLKAKSFAAVYKECFQEG